MQIVFVKVWLGEEDSCSTQVAKGLDDGKPCNWTAAPTTEILGNTEKCRWRSFVSCHIV